MNVLIVYYSTYGNVYRMATLVAEGVQEIPGAQPVGIVSEYLFLENWS